MNVSEPALIQFYSCLLDKFELKKEIEINEGNTKFYNLSKRRLYSVDNYNNFYIWNIDTLK